MAAKGKLVVIEGTDGSGKKTQTALLVERLNREGRQVATFSFPQYGKSPAKLVEDYLAGKFGPPDKLNPYLASVCYAVDRADASGEVKAKLEEGRLVILDRYVDSNVGHQGGKINDPQERDKYIRWLYETEYGIFKIPRPDMVVILRVPAEVGQELSKKRGAQDGHESNLEHLKNAEAAYLWLAQKHPEDHVVVECVRDGELLTPEEIHAKVYDTIKPIL